MCWVAKLFGALLPVDRLSYKLVQGLQRGALLGRSRCLSSDQCFKLQSAVLSKGGQVLMLGLAQGLRPVELKNSSVSCLKGDVSRTKYSKFAEHGRSIDAAPVVGHLCTELLKWIKPDERFEKDSLNTSGSTSDTHLSSHK